MGYKSAYPDDYRDPEWDGSYKEFIEVVIPARIKALEQTFSELLPEGFIIEWKLDDG